MLRVIVLALVFTPLAADATGCVDKYDYFAMGGDKIMAYTVNEKRKMHEVKATWTVKGATQMTWALNFKNEKGENRVGVTDEGSSTMFIFDPCAQSEGTAILKWDRASIDLAISGQVEQPVGAQFDESDGKIYVAMFRSGLTVIDPHNGYSLEHYTYDGLHDPTDPTGHKVHNVHVMTVGKGAATRTEIFINDLGDIWVAPRQAIKGHGLVRFNKDTKKFEQVVSGDPGIHLRASQRDAKDPSVIWGLTQETCPAWSETQTDSGEQWICDQTKLYKFTVENLDNVVKIDALLEYALPPRSTRQLDKEFTVEAGEGGADIISRVNANTGKSELIVTDRYGQVDGGQTQRPGKLYVFPADATGGYSLTLDTGAHGNPRYTVVVKDKWLVSANNKQSSGQDQPLAVHEYPLRDGSVAQNVLAPPQASFVLENVNGATDVPVSMIYV